MLARASTGAVIGIDAHDVVVETHCQNGIPTLALVGLARGAMRESAVRVRSAIEASGIALGSHKLVVNLLPAELEKDASAIDLAVALSVVAAAERFRPEALDGRRFFGELSLGGRLEPVRGAVLMADLALRAHDRELILPLENAPEAAVVAGLRVLGARSLAEVVAHLRGEATLPPVAPRPSRGAARGWGCLSDVRGQARAKRALEIAAAGGHNVLLIGPPGSGKTMLARRLPGLLPPLSPDESLEVTRIQSAAGLLAGGGLACERPFRAPHHTASEAAVCGGGSIPRPGEVTLAHRGVLFLDELPEFSRRALESLREPLEEGSIHVARAARSIAFPARAQLVAAMNPCPCGRFRVRPAASGGGGEPCVCSFEQIQRYRQRISGPLLDRIDLHVAVDTVAWRDFAQSGSGETTAAVAARVLAARERQAARLGPGRVNAGLGDGELRAAVRLDSDATTLVAYAVDERGLSTRSASRVLKVARTIADLACDPEVREAHVREALGLRLLDLEDDPELAG